MNLNYSTWRTRNTIHGEQEIQEVGTEQEMTKDMKKESASTEGMSRMRRIKERCGVGLGISEFDTRLEMERTHRAYGVHFPVENAGMPAERYNPYPDIPLCGRLAYSMVLFM